MKSYIPNTLPLEDLDYKLLFGLVGNANAELARYDGLLQGIVNPSVMLSPLTNEEAVLSSKIEGTQATVDEVLEQEAGIFKEGEKGKDIQEILNYRKALHFGHHYLEERPITLSFVRELHKILMDSVRGQNKNPGEFRDEQNWIGKYGSTIENATFVPPNPFQLPNYLKAWQDYMAFDDSDILLQTGSFFGGEFILLLLPTQKSSVISRSENRFFICQRQNRRGNTVKKDSIMGDKNQHTGIIKQIFFQPDHRFQIKMVCWLVQKQSVRPCDQNPCEFCPFLPAAAQFTKRH